ncbi:MAG: toll/interleukin-1 receptor domain-containing protein [Ruminococcus sp.]|nr:toll/interleukin-1 receptor domain-containing protein [Ruminococcus sp.]
MRLSDLIDGEYTYFAFICYTHADYKEARKLRNRLQRYGLPSRLAKISGEKKRLVPIFLDDEDMLTGIYNHIDHDALRDSKYLIVICSENLHAHDKMVNEEIREFLSYGSSYDRIIPFIINDTLNPEVNCFPGALRDINENDSVNIIGASIYSPDGKLRYKSAYLKVIAKIHSIKTTELENANKKRRRRRVAVSIISIIMVLSLLFGFMMYVLNTSFLSSNSLKVRYEGTKEWSEALNDAKVGDVVQFRYEFENDRGLLSVFLSMFADNNGLKISSEDVIIRYILPTNMEYINDSTILYNSNHQDGIKLSENTAATTGINIGNYLIYGNAIVIINCRVIDKTLAYGDNQLVCWANTTIDGKVSSKDDASVMLYKPYV